MSVEEAERLAQQEKVSGILECRYKAALSRAAAAAAAKHEKLVAKQTKLAVNAARRVEYLKERNKNDRAKKAKARQALEEEKAAAAAKLLLIMPGS